MPKYNIMSLRLSFILCCIVSYALAFAQQQPLHYFLPKGEYDKNIPTPEQFLGWQIGEWHVSHDQVVAYMRELDRVSDRISIEQYARSYEQRPLMILYISHPDNLMRLREIKEQHQNWCNPKAEKVNDIERLPAILYQGYSIHGNEASGTNAAMLMAYYYAASLDLTLDNQLHNTVILFDPCMNPDGLQRFSTWVNQHKSKNLCADGNSREFNEVWPQGRTNHYYFDLNRDWLVTQMPESQGRVRIIQEWLPNMLTDHHEMGTNATFFFQPGVPSRVGWLTPKENQTLTNQIATYHAKALDKNGVAYFTQENYDDFYYGKGSSYMDLQGGIGILFEQASARGHLQRSANGLLPFSYAIKNQVITSLSTLEATTEMRKTLLQYQRNFYKNALKDSGKERSASIIFGESHDRFKNNELLKLLLRQHIEVYENHTTIKENGLTFDAGKSYIIPLQQPQYTIIKALFDKKTTFTDSIFYDVSAWTLPLALDMPYAYTDAKISPNASPIKAVENLHGQIIGGKAAYGYLISWEDYNAPVALQSLLEEGVLVKTATKPFRTATNGNMMSFGYGTLFVPLQHQSRSAATIHQLMAAIAQDFGLDLYPIDTGLSNEGIDFGSPNFVTVRSPKVAVIVGDGVSATDAGEAWHLLDQRYNMTISHLDTKDISTAKLENYNFLYMPDGKYNTLGDNAKQKIKDWVSAGNVLFAAGADALTFLSNQNWTNIKLKTNPIPQNNITTAPNRKSYTDAENNTMAQQLSGAIFEAQMDISHPLCYGYHRNSLPVFLSDATTMELSKNPYATPLTLGENATLAGYVPKKIAQKMANSAIIGAFGVGNGRIIATATPPNFRAFWLGTNRLLANALFFSPLISKQTLEKGE